MSKLPSKAGENISKKLAKDLTENFQKRFKVANKSSFFTVDVFQRLMKLPGCVAIRIYPGLENDTFTPVLVAVDANGDNIYYDPALTKSISELDSNFSAIEERAGTCPPYCASNDFF